MFHQLLNRIRECRKVLFNGVNLEKQIKLLNNLIDEPDNFTPGFYFGNLPENKLESYWGVTNSVQTLIGSIRSILMHWRMSISF